MTDVVLVERNGAVGTITLNRPAQMNAITVELGRELGRALCEIVDDVNVIVIRGSGGNFCVGGDFHELARLRAAGVHAMAELFRNFGHACATIEELAVPVICAVEGYAMAGGFELMQAADIVLIHENAIVADTHSRFGQIPGGGSSQRLPRLVGRQRALAHMLTGDRLTAPEAIAWGLAYRQFAASEFENAVIDFAQRLAAKDPAALAESKRLVYAGLTLPLAEGLAMEHTAVLTHLTRSSAGAGIDSFTKGSSNA